MHRPSHLFLEFRLSSLSEGTPVMLFRKNKSNCWNLRLFYRGPGFSWGLAGRAVSFAWWIRKESANLDWEADSRPGNYQLVRCMHYGTEMDSRRYLTVQALSKIRAGAFSKHPECLSWECPRSREGKMCPPEVLDAWTTLEFRWNEETKGVCSGFC